MLCTDPTTRIHYECITKGVGDTDEYATRERSASSEKWAATMYRSCTTVTNRHPFALHDLVVRDSVARVGGREAHLRRPASSIPLVSQS